MRGTNWTVGAVLALAALAPRAAFGAAYYVNDPSTAGDQPFPGCAAMGPGQSSAPCGTCARPCDSPQLAYDANPVGPGDTIYLNTGRYSPDAGAPGLALVVPGKEGAAGAPLVVEGLVDASGRCARDDAGVPLVLMDGLDAGSVGVFITVSYVTVKGFGITRMAPNGSEPYGSGVRIVGPGDAPPDGGFPDAGPTGFVVTGMEIYGLKGGAASPVDIDDWVPSCDGCEVSWNRLHSCGSCNAAVWIQGTPGVRVIGNEIYSNTLLASGTPSQIYLAAAPAPVVRNNLVFANGGDALKLLGCLRPRLCGSQVSSLAQVVNNTFWRNVLVSQDFDDGEIAIEDGSGGATFENNLIGYDGEPAFYTDGTGFLASDYNGFHNLGDGGFAFVGGTAVGSFQEWQFTGVDSHSLEANPLFSATASDFHLSSTGGFFGEDGVLHWDSRVSPFLDLGDPAAPIGQQRAPNRGRVNLGAYGGTREASLTPVIIVGENGDGQHGAAGSTLQQSLAVAVLFEGVGDAAAGVEVAFDVTSGDGRVSPALAVTDATGAAATRLTLGTAATTVVRASLPNVLNAGEVTFTATVDPDAGVPDGGPPPDAGPPDAGPPGNFGVCGCASSGAGPVALLALAMAVCLLSRRRVRP